MNFSSPSLKECPLAGAGLLRLGMSPKGIERGFSVTLLSKCIGVLDPFQVLRRYYSIYFS